VVAKDMSEKITQKHLEEVYEKQVQTVVTQCPSCIHKFRKNSKGLIIKDLVSYLNDCIESVQD
jgi:Fe-S oxidoreductase